MTASPFDDVADWRPVARSAKTLWRISGLLVVSIFTGSAAVLGVLADLTPLIVVAGVTWLALATTVWIVSGRRWAAWGYAERDADLLIRRGVLFRRLSVVPYGRMQFIDVAQGPLDRMLKTASVVLHTAAASSDAKVALLDEPVARELRDRLAALGEAHATGV